MLEKGGERDKLKIIVRFRSYPTRNRKFPKNSNKNSKKLKYTIMPSFQAKISLKRLRKRENNNYRSIPFCSYPTRNRKFLNNSKKFKKLKNTIMASFQAKIGW